MAKWWALAGIFFIIILIGGIYVGRSYQHWVRTQAKIGELGAEQQDQAWRDFVRYAPGGKSALQRKKLLVKCWV